MKAGRWVFVLITILGSVFLTGCAGLEIAMVGMGSSATIEDTGFFKSYDGLAPASDMDKKSHYGLPDLYYVSPKINMQAYKKVFIVDFTSRTTNINKISGLQIRQFKTLRKDLADHIAESFDGPVFEKAIRISERIDPKDTEAIQKLSADAVLMGNIKEIISLGGLTATQVEYKLVDIKTGEEVIKAIHRSTTDADKVAMGQVRRLTAVILNIARNK